MATKLRNRWYVSALLASCFLVMHCNKFERTVFVHATITGVYNQVCFRGQGIALTFNGETMPYKGMFYIADNSPEEFGLNGSVNFPISVEVDTAHLPQNCAYPVIHLKKVVKR
jgi:hypothetical protein